MGHPVVPEHRLMVHRLAEKWQEKWAGAPSMPPGKTWRGSYAGKCGRQIEHMIRADEPSNPTDLAGYWVMGLGSAVHELLGPSIEAWASESTIEIFEELGVELGDNGYGHADLVLTTDSKKVLFELKTINGFGYKKSVIDGEGPKHMAKLQAALYAEAIEADLMVIGYLGMENVGLGYASKANLDDIGRFASEWRYTPDEFMPWAKEERERLEEIAKVVTAGGSVPRTFSVSDPDIPYPAEITGPGSGAWRLLSETGALLNAGKTWTCNYCNWQDKCVKNMQNDR